jgi:hypothetical protein
MLRQGTTQPAVAAWDKPQVVGKCLCLPCSAWVPIEQWPLTIFHTHKPPHRIAWHRSDMTDDGTYGGLLYGLSKYMECCWTHQVAACHHSHMAWAKRPQQVRDQKKLIGIGSALKESFASVQLHCHASCITEDISQTCAALQNNSTDCFYGKEPI